jgi:hypothetical protein
MAILELDPLSVVALEAELDAGIAFWNSQRPVWAAADYRTSAG